MKPLIRFSVNHPVSIVAVLIGVVLLGVLCAVIIPVDFLPLMSSRILLIAAEYPGISTREIRTMVTMPLEDAFASLKGLKGTSSVSRDGLSLLTLELHWGSDIDLAQVESREIIDICFETLPAGCRKPVVSINDDSKKETLVLAVIPRDGDLRYGRHLTETDIKPRIQRLPGVASVSLAGGEKEEIQVRLHKDKLEARQISIQNVADILSGANFEYPAGTILAGEKELTFKTSGLFTSVDDIGAAPLSYNNGSLVRVSHMADVVRTVQKKESFFLYNDRECIKVGIQKKADASPLSVSSLVKKEVSRLEELYGSWYEFRIIEDLSEEIRGSLVSLLMSAFLGAAATAAVIKLFLKSWGLSFLLSGVIFLSAAGSLLALTAFQKTLNIMSLSGMAVGIGMVVDAGAVTIENIQKEIHRNPGDFRGSIIRAAENVVLSNTGSAMTTFIVFLPLFFISGLLGELFSDMAIAVIAAIGFSCLLSFTYIPASCFLMAKSIAALPEKNRIIKKMEDRYTRILGGFFAKPPRAFIPAAVCLGTGIFSLLSLDYRLMPELAAKTIQAEILLPPDTPVSSMEYTAEEIARRLLRQPYIESVRISGGLEHDDYRQFSDPSEAAEKLRISAGITGAPAEAAAALEGLFAGTKYSITFGERLDLLSQILSLRNDSYILSGDSPGSVLARAEQLAGASDGAGVIPGTMARQYVFTPDRVAGARFSVSAQYMAAAARSALEGQLAVPFYENGREIPLRVKLRDEDMGSLADLENTPVLLDGASVPLGLLGSFTEEINENVLYRYNRKDAKQLVNYRPPEETLPADLESPGFLEFREMMKSGILLLIVTILLLYFLMGAQFESFLIPALLLLALPPAFSGAFLFLFLTGKTLNINSVIALVVLFGTSVNNSILLYEGALSALPVTADSLITTCREKFRAILITNLTTICALVPFAIDPRNVSAQSSLAAAIIGGLLFSTVLVLLVVPVLFLLVLPKRIGRHE